MDALGKFGEHSRFLSYALITPYTHYYLYAPRLAEAIRGFMLIIILFLKEIKIKQTKQNAKHEPILNWWLHCHAMEKKQVRKRTSVGLDLLSFHSVRELVLNISVRELKYYQ